MSQEGPKILQDSLLPEGGTRVKGALKIAAANLSLFFPPATILLAGIGYIVLIPQGLGMWCTGKGILAFGKKEDENTGRNLMAEGKDLMWTGAMLCVPYVGPALLMADGAVNVTTGKNYGADGYLATFENFKIAVNDTKEYFGQKIDGLKKTLGLSKEVNDKAVAQQQSIDFSQEKKKNPNMKNAVTKAKEIPTKNMKLGGRTYATLSPNKTEERALSK